jgi:uncharacterized metal-binding protein
MRVAETNIHTPDLDTTQRTGIMQRWLVIKHDLLPRVKINHHRPNQPLALGCRGCLVDLFYAPIYSSNVNPPFLEIASARIGSSAWHVPASCRILRGASHAIHLREISMFKNERHVKTGAKTIWLAALIFVQACALQTR